MISQPIKLCQSSVSVGFLEIYDIELNTGVTTNSDINRAVQAQKMTRGWKFRIYKVEELYYPYSENKGADQLRSNDLRLCFRIGKKSGFIHAAAHMIYGNNHGAVRMIWRFIHTLDGNGE